MPLAFKRSVRHVGLTLRRRQARRSDVTPGVRALAGLRRLTGHSQRALGLDVGQRWRQEAGLGQWYLPGHLVVFLSAERYALLGFEFYGNAAGEAELLVMTEDASVAWQRPGSFADHAVACGHLDELDSLAHLGRVCGGCQECGPLDAEIDHPGADAVFARLGADPEGIGFGLPRKTPSLLEGLSKLLHGKASFTRGSQDGRRGSPAGTGYIGARTVRLHRLRAVANVL